MNQIDHQLLCDKIVIFILTSKKYANKKPKLA
jgi:hypothetical protein